MEYRGMTVAEQRRVIADQAAQMEDNARRRDAERERERQWTEYEAYLRAQGDRGEAEWRARAAHEQAQLYRDHLAQEAEFKGRQRYLNREFYGENSPDDSYYEQWGQSIR
jgi:hypothetical protein